MLPGATLGVMGGGQLGRMFVHAAQQAGYFTAVLDPDADSPAGRVSHHHVHADYLDVDGLARLSRLADAITTEFENVPARALASLAGDVPVAPAAEAVSIAQDRIREKAHFVRCGVACAPYAVIESAEHLAAVGRRTAARHPEDRKPGLRRQGPAAGGHARRAGRGLEGGRRACPACSRSAFSSLSSAR